MIQAFVPAMIAAGWGRSIQISSRNAISPHANLASHGAVKAALNNLTLSLSKALAGTGGDLQRCDAWVALHPHA
jgi:NAD(P)-dependent dehydrogenase (short-subunit alcohol dehydrogenase family)